MKFIGRSIPAIAQAVACVALIGSLAACGGDETAEATKKADSTTDTTDTTDTSGTGDTSSTGGSTDTGTPADCSMNGFNAVFERAGLDSANQYFRYVAASAENTPFDQLVIESYQGSQFNGPSAPGTFSLDGTNYADCGLCVLAYTGCNGQSCEKTFYADAGTVEISALGAAGTQFTGSLDGLVFQEVTIDQSSWTSTPVANGQSWCMDGYSFDQTVEDGLGSGGGGSETVPDTTTAECVAAGNGNGIGANVADFEMQNVAGERVSLHTSCGQTKAVWFALTAGWCGACETLLPEFAARYEADKDNGLQLRIVVGEDQNSQPATEEYCRNYATSKNLDPSIVFCDPSWQTTFSNLWAYPQDGSIGLPWQAVLRGSNMEYVYSSQQSSSTADATINSLLAE